MNCRKGMMYSDRYLKSKESNNWFNDEEGYVVI